VILGCNPPCEGGLPNENDLSKRFFAKDVFYAIEQGKLREGQHILDEFCTNCGCHRKYAIRLLNGAPLESRPVKHFRQKMQGPLRGVGYLDSGSGVGVSFRGPVAGNRAPTSQKAWSAMRALAAAFGAMLGRITLLLLSTR